MDGCGLPDYLWNTVCDGGLENKVSSQEQLPVQHYTFVHALQVNLLKSQKKGMIEGQNRGRVSMWGCDISKLADNRD